MYACMCMYVSMYAYIYVCVYIYTHILTYTHNWFLANVVLLFSQSLFFLACMHTTCTCIHICMCVYIHTYSYIYISIHTTGTCMNTTSIRILLLVHLYITIKTAYASTHKRTKIQSILSEHAYINTYIHTCIHTRRCFRGIKWVFPSPDKHNLEGHFVGKKVVFFYEFKSSTQDKRLMYEPRCVRMYVSMFVFGLCE